MKSYEYSQRKGVLEITWDDFSSLAARLVEGIAHFDPEIIIGIARAGLFPATAAACMLRREFYPARVTRRFQDQVVYPQPRWKIPISPEVADKKTVIIDEIADSGQTLALAAQEALKLGAQQVITAALVCHSWADPMPEVCALVSDALVIFPWNQRVYIDNRWQPHPELVAALQAQQDSSE